MEIDCLEYNKDDGVFNEEVDKMERHDDYWSDINPFYYGLPKELDRLKCRNCGGVSFEVLSIPDEYETLAKCWGCNLYCIVHSG